MHLNIRRKLGYFAGCVSLIFLGGCKEESPWDLAFQSVATFAQTAQGVNDLSPPEIMSPDTGEALVSRHFCIDVDMTASQPDRPDARVDQIIQDLAGKTLPSDNVKYCETVLFICDASADCNNTEQYQAALGYIRNELSEVFNVPISASEALDLIGVPMANGAWTATPETLSANGFSLLQATVSHYTFAIETISPSLP